MTATADSRALPRTIDASPPMQMMEMLYGALATQMISVAAELGIADLLADEPQTVDHLAASCSADSAALYRLLRALACLGVFTEVAPRTFGLTPLAKTLRTGVTGSMRELAQEVGGRTRLLAYSELVHSVRTGKPAFDEAHGISMWAYLQSHPQEMALFSRGMGNLASEAHSAAFDAYDLSRVRCLVDVGGGQGYLIAAVLPRYPSMRAVLFDAPHVTQGAARVLDQAGIADRTEVVSGDVFESVPPGGDAYVLSSILFSYTDAEAITILSNIRQAMEPAGKILILEPLIPQEDGYHPGKLLDVCQLALHKGGVRSKAEFGALFSAAGLRRAEAWELWPTAPTDLIVAVPA
jgi:O-methyltransferase domain/Dimerisation domain